MYIILNHHKAYKCLYHDIIMIKIDCKKCGHEWNPRRERPLRCPRCGSFNYNIEGYDKCALCNKNYLSLHNHHKNGNHGDDSQTNIIRICAYCHSAIHNGEYHQSNKRKARTRTILPIILEEKINQLRKEWLNNKNKRRVEGDENTKSPKTSDSDKEKLQ